MARCLLVECRSDNLRLNVACHLGNLLRTLVYEQYNHIYFGMVVGDGIGNTLQQHGFTRFRLRHNQRALTLADWREQIDDTIGECIVSISREVELLARKERCHKLELHTVADKFGVQTVDFGYAHERKIFFALFRRADYAANGIT